MNTGHLDQRNGDIYDNKTLIAKSPADRESVCVNPTCAISDLAESLIILDFQILSA